MTSQRGNRRFRYIIAMAIMAFLVCFTACNKSSENKRSLKLISDIDKNGSYDMDDFCFYCLLSDGTDDIETERDKDGRSIKETDPCISYANIVYDEDNTKCINVKVYDLQEYIDKQISEYDFEFGDALHAKVKWTKYDIEEQTSTEGYYMIEFDSEGRKIYQGHYIGNDLDSFREYSYSSDKECKVYVYNSESEIVNYEIYEDTAIFESCKKYSADNILMYSNEIEYYDDGTMKRHTRINGDEHENFLYNEHGILTKTESYSDNDNLSVAQEYDDAGYLIKVSNYDYSGVLEYIAEYKNDEYGMPIYEKVQYMADNSIKETEYKNEYKLNDFGKPETIQVYTVEGKLVETYTYTYDEEGKVIGSVYSKAEE